jgi:hypothetical protein
LSGVRRGLGALGEGRAREGKGLNRLRVIKVSRLSLAGYYTSNRPGKRRY